MELYPNASSNSWRRFIVSLLSAASVDEQSYLLVNDRLERQSVRDGRSKLSISWSILSRIETKAAAYLQHISMMIAVIGLLLGVFAESRVEQAILIVELLGYLALALGCVRCLYHVPGIGITGYQPHRHPPELWNEREEIVYLSEVSFREDILTKCTKWMWILTMIFGATVILHIFVGSAGASL